MLLGVGARDKAGKCEISVLTAKRRKKAKLAVLHPFYTNKIMDLIIPLYHTGVFMK